ncbi:5'-nucleotidase C-terminal domain-containing protein [Halorussus gelatinilyticus]|uniref:5'-nucleotidase C-terminal domain-containing protein n=1 Tax=Halorussus gelatinilyticus TaxID=2937524 RepID=A0A8U0IJ27_9EURY|nr:5'-nucleotidase C-terminal domain-containing protein [Halorussus gelatinilyticus]UPW00274.1 5'-nucleotidase C-terminal domain-containing protein [Halorussus gelatinilyticus]
MRLLQYSDVENAYDHPERIGRLAGCIESLRDDRTVVVGTGDDLGPGVLAMVEDGAQSLDFFRAVESDAETFGNHDFDYGLDAARRVVRQSPQTWVTNVSDGDDPFGDTVATTTIERGGTSVGLVGVTDPASSVPDELAVSAPVDAVRDGVADLRAAGSDWTVALAHVRDDRLDDIATETDVDAILAGHVHGERHDRIDGTLLVRPGANGRVLWEVELGKKATATRHEVAGAPRDDEVAERLRARLAETGLAEVVGVAEEPLDRDREASFAGERRITNFVTDAYRWAGDADVGYADTRMLRGGPALSDEVTLAEIRGLEPFAADLCRAELSGETLRDLAEQAVATDERARRSPTPEAWWAHFSGMTVVWDRAEQTVREVRVGGESLDPRTEYALATNGYVVDTDEFPAIGREHVTETVGVQYEALVEYARTVGVDAELDGRIAVEE